jgi:hypothetical protein
VEIMKKSRRDRGMKVQFGEKEKILMSYLGTNQTITVNEFSRIANIKKMSPQKHLYGWFSPTY